VLRLSVMACLAIILVFAVGLSLKPQPVEAATGINSRLNFQGRLFNSAGAVIPDGDYNVEFKVVQDGDGCNPTSGTFPCSGTVKWTETRTGANKMTVRNGYFSVELGAVTAFGTSVDWNQDTLWLSINMGGTGSPAWDGEMKPLKRLTSTPYALNAGQLGGLTSTSFLQLAQGVQNDTSITNPSIFVNKNNASGTPNILQLQKAGSDVFVIDNTGLATAAGGLTVTTSKTLTINGDGFTDLTGNGLTVSSNALTLNLATSADGLSVTTSSGSGLEVLASGLTLLQGCSNGQVLQWNETTDVWSCTTPTAASNSFATIDTPSGTDPVADSSTDTLQLLVTGTNLTITGADSPEAITFDISESALAGAGLVANSSALDIASANGGIAINTDNIALTLAASADALSATTSSGSGMEILSSGLGMLQGCSNNQVLQWNETTDVWACATISGGGGTLATSYAAGVAQADSTLSLDSTRLGLIIMDNDTPLGANLFSVKEHTNDGGSVLFGVTTGGLTVVDTAGNNGLIFDSSAHELKIYDSTAANFASITATTNGATFKSNTGTTTVGGGSGNISMSLTNVADVLTFQKTASLSGAYTANDFTITRTLTQTGNSSSGSAVLKIEDTSTASSAANIAPDVLQINQSNASAGGNLINAKAGGVSKFSLSTAGALTFNSDVFTDLTGNGLTIASNALTVNLTSSGTTGSTSSNSGLEVAAGGLTLLKGCADGQGLSYTDAGGWACAALGGATDLQTAYDNSSSPATITTAAGKGILFKAGVEDLNLFEVQNSAGLEILSVNSLTTGLNLVANPSFENNTSGWVKKGAATVAVSTSNEVAAQYEDRELKIVTTAAANDGATYNYQFPAAGTYSISFWAKSTASTGANISFGYRVNTTTGDVNCLATQTLTTTWTQFNCANVSVSGTVNDTAPTIGIYVKQSDATVRTIYIDGVTLVQSATVLNYDNPALNLQIDSNYSNITLNGGNTGELQPWNLSSNVLTPGCSANGNREQAASVFANGYIYVVGGFEGTNAMNTVCYAKINSDGSIGTWIAAANTLPAVRRHLAAVVANGYLYAIGGADTAGTAVSTIYYAKLNSDGTVGTWQLNSASLGAARLGVTARFNNGFMYAVGGCTDTTCTANSQDDIYYGKVNADGSITGLTSPATLSTTTLLPNNRGMGSLVFGNGYLYYIGGSGSEATAGPKSTVYYAQINSDGSIGAFSGTTGGTGTALPANRVMHTSVIANGYIYVIAGCTAFASGSCSAASAVNTVYYSKINSDGTNSNWITNGNALPVNRAAHTSVVTNGYIYVLGGLDGTPARTATTYYSSTSRVMVAGALDLVGLSSQGLADFSGGGALTAGNIRAVGDLRVDGYADFNNGISVDSAINLNGVSASPGQVVFNVNNSSSNSIFNIKHMAANFGSLVTAGSFAGINSEFSEEFNVDIAGTAADAVTAGDGGNWYVDVVTTCTWSQAAGNLNGYLRLALTATTTACLAAPGNTQNVSQKIFQVGNLPVFQAKFRVSNTAATSDAFVGLMDTQTGTATNDTRPANGLYFWGNNTTTGWVAEARRASGAQTVLGACGGTISTTQFAVVRIEVLSATDVRFWADSNASDGVNLQNCGTITTTQIPVNTTALSSIIYGIQTAAATNNIDVDYMRVWQDDAPAADVADAEASSTPIDSLDSTGFLETPALEADSGIQEDQIGIIDFTTATSEDTVFNNDLYVKGTLYADKIRANQIEGLEIFTDKISSLQDQLAREQAQQQGSTTTESSGQPLENPDPSSHVLGLSSLNLQSVTISLDLNVVGSLTANGGLIVGGSADFRGETKFQKLVSFMDRVVFRQDVSFQGRTTFNNDTAGFATIYETQQEIKVKFDKPYSQSPVVVVSVNNGKFVVYSYKDLSPEGFTIILRDPATEQFNFSWTALDIKDVKTSQLPITEAGQKDH
jgi:hypothetical protein